MVPYVELLAFAALIATAPIVAWLCVHVLPFAWRFARGATLASEFARITSGRSVSSASAPTSSTPARAHPRRTSRAR